MQDMMQDFGGNDVNDGAENRERRALLMGSLSGRVMVREPLEVDLHPFRVLSLTTFNLLTLAVLIAALAALVVL